MALPRVASYLCLHAPNLSVLRVTSRRASFKIGSRKASYLNETGTQRTTPSAHSSPAERPDVDDDKAGIKAPSVLGIPRCRLNRICIVVHLAHQVRLFFEHYDSWSSDNELQLVVAMVCPQVVRSGVPHSDSQTLKSATTRRRTEIQACGVSFSARIHRHFWAGARHLKDEPISSEKVSSADSYSAETCAHGTYSLRGNGCPTATAISSNC